MPLVKIMVKYLLIPNIMVVVIWSLLIKMAPAQRDHMVFFELLYRFKTYTISKTHIQYIQKHTFGHIVYTFF